MFSAGPNDAHTRPGNTDPTRSINGLLRHYFPQGTDLSTHTAEHLDTVTAELNDRPRNTLNRDTPTERMNTHPAN